MRIALYGNGSSGNHGCEAIVRGTYTLIKEPNNFIRRNGRRHYIWISKIL